MVFTYLLKYLKRMLENERNLLFLLINFVPNNFKVVNLFQFKTVVFDYYKFVIF